MALGWQEIDWIFHDERIDIPGLKPEQFDPILQLFHQLRIIDV